MFKLLFIFVASLGYAGMTNSGTFTLMQSNSWASILNKPQGLIEGDGSQFLKIVNEGTVQIENCIMLEEVESSGTLNAHLCKFVKDVILTGGDTVLDSCQLINLVISNPQAQVSLKGNTIITGSIIFKQGQGVVSKDPEVLILNETVNEQI
jgi:hypothetical protein